MAVFTFFSVLIAIVSVLLVGTILLQEPKESIATYGGSTAPVQRIGINPKTDFLEKTTWVLVGLLLALTLLTGLFSRGVPSSSALTSPNLIQLDKEQSEHNQVEPNTIETAKASATTEAASDTSDLRLKKGGHLAKRGKKEKARVDSTGYMGKSGSLNPIKYIFYKHFTLPLG